MRRRNETRNLSSSAEAILQSLAKVVKRDCEERQDHEPTDCDQSHSKQPQFAWDAEVVHVKWFCAELNRLLQFIVEAQERILRETRASPFTKLSNPT
jgi:hypothetical protein